MEKNNHEEMLSNDNEIEQLLNDIPEDVKEEIVEGITAIRKTQSMSFPPEALVMTKVNEEHISEFLAASRENMRKSYEEKRNNKFFLSFLILVALAFVITIIVLLKDQPQIMEKIIYIFLGFLGGVAGGYGLGRKSGSNKEDD